MNHALRILLFSRGGELGLHSTALLGLAWLGNHLLLRRDARWRLILWRSVLVMLCLLPLEFVVRAKGFQVPIPLPAGWQLASSGNLSSGTADTQAIIQPVVDPRSMATVVRANLTGFWSEPPVIPLSAAAFWGQIWLFGSAAGAIGLIWIQFRLRHLCENAEPPDAHLRSLLERLQNRLGLRRGVTVRISDQAGSAFVCGLWRPVVILPARLLADLSRAELRTLLLHELAHLRSRDLPWSLAWKWLQTITWIHPLTWKIPAAHRLACEQEADRVAVSHCNPDRYGRLLARLALRAFALSTVESALVLNAGSQISQRLLLLQRGPPRAWRRRHSLGGLGLVAALTIGVAGWGFPTLQAAETVPLKHYDSAEWQFSIDIPQNWNAFPPQPSNSPYEVARFESREHGFHNSIIFRAPRDPAEPIETWLQHLQGTLAKDGFKNFVTGTAAIGSTKVVTLDFDRPSQHGKTWSVRYYIVPSGTLLYTLGFGTDEDRPGMFALSDRVAKTFVAR